ncbi:MAG: HD-GYP domain-containing protein [Proteobacteria bacterium]|nr:HD-GYP domain-containing protein [Pseudomonadota bacterium]MBU1715037.1 HD-GYP domain-containing protein [Pseudomonadota bacterium]
MIYSLPAKELKVGMYVIMPVSWLYHPFLRNQFLITSQGDLNEILKSGVEEVQVDSSKSQASEDFQSITHPSGPQEKEEPETDYHRQPPENWNPEKLMTQELRDVIHNVNMPPQKKSVAVYKQSIKIIDNVFKNPTTEVINESKKAIAEVAELILHDEKTSRNLLRITSHDFYTYTHSVNVGILSIYLAKRLYGKTDSHDLRELGAAFFLHDLGKIRVAPEILNKPARLTEMEMKRMRVHPFQSFKILQETGTLTEECRVICMQHHEREDGTGYPRRLQGNEIHDYGRICSIADVFDALTSERPYKRSLSAFEALSIMKNEMLGFFHKEIFANFVLLFTPDKSS